jgi:hypothetical protein
MLFSVQKSKHKTYADATRLATVSLLHNNISTDTDENDETIRVLQTRIYRAARSEGALLFDITKCKPNYTDQQCMVELEKQHPNVHACLLLNEGNTRYLEVYIKAIRDSNNIIHNGITFSKSKLQVLPCKALDEQSQILKLKLSHLPMFTPEEVLEGLKTSLAIFGTILDIGIAKEQATGFFMGNGYAVLDVHQQADAEIKFQKLSHQLSWMESTSDFFRATWNNMPTWCRYCHKDGHTKFQCEASKARVLCYSCQEQGHRSYECPRRNSNTIPNKKLNRKTTVARAPKPVVASPKTTNTTLPSLLPEPEKVFDSVEEVDAMSTDDGESSVDETVQQYRDDIQLHTMELNEFTVDDIHKAIKDVYDANEIEPVTDGIDSNIITGWKTVEHTARADAIVSWLQSNQFVYDNNFNLSSSRTVETGLTSEANSRSL